jgi:DNA invertase Pin-like site-specific DNA recombinase
MTMVFGMLAELERDLISKRTKEALATKRAQGVRLGRPPVPGKSKLDCRIDEIRKLLDKRVGVTSLAKIFNCTTPTMSNLAKENITGGNTVDDKRLLSIWRSTEEKHYRYSRQVLHHH